MKYPSLPVSVMTLACATLLGAAGCDRNRQGENNSEGDREKVADETTTDVGKVVDEPGRFVGKRVVVSGDVENVYGDRAFRLEDTGEIFQDEMLVLTKSPIAIGGSPLREDEKLVVTGKVRMLDVPEVERDLGWDLQPELESEFKSKPVLLASDIERVTRTAHWSEQDSGGVLVGVWSVYSTVKPEALAGQRIELTGEPVTKLGQQGFWVGREQGGRLFVAAPQNGPQLNDGQLVDVTGTLKKMPDAAGIQKQFGLSQDQAQALQQQALYVDAKNVKPSEKVKVGARAD